MRKREEGEEEEGKGRQREAKEGKGRKREREMRMKVVSECCSILSAAVLDIVSEYYLGYVSTIKCCFFIYNHDSAVRNPS
jgi:hypothetical protein